MPKLHVTNGALEGTMFHLLEKRVTVGRTEENLIRINDSTVSKHHAVIFWDGNGYKLQDLDSTNGTRVNGEPISEAKLTSGDTVAFGDVELRYEAPVGKPAHTASPAAPPPIAATSPLVAAPGAAPPAPTISTPPTLAPSTGRGRLHIGIRSPTAPGPAAPPDSPYAPPPPAPAVRNPCKNHPHVSAVDRCAGCAEMFCGNCLVEVHGQKYCGACNR